MKFVNAVTVMSFFLKYDTLTDRITYQKLGLVTRLSVDFCAVVSVEQTWSITSINLAYFRCRFSLAFHYAKVVCK